MSAYLSRYLTSLVGGDGDRSVLPHLGRQRRHAVQRFDLKGVVSVGQQVSHRHGGVVEARGSRQEVNVTPARLATQVAAATAVGDATPAAAFAEDGEGDVPAAAGVFRPAPVQDDGGLVNGRYHVSRSRRGSWRRR